VQYLTNIGIWLSGFVKGWRYFRKEVRYEQVEALWYLYWFFDVGANVLTGGDPEESASSRVHKDRHALFPKILIRLLEKIDKRHGPKVVNWRVGEGSHQNRELSNMAQASLTVFWLITILGGFYYGLK